jgi:hypothetical protein
MIGYRNRAQEATLTGGNWQAVLPLNNLKGSSLSKAAVAASVAPADTQFTIVSPQPRLVRVFALLAHNLGVLDTCRVRAWSDAGGTSLIYDSGFNPVWPSIYGLGDVDWNDDAFWSLTIRDEDRAGLIWNMAIVLPAAIFATRWLVEIVKGDTTLPSIGMLWMSDAWQPVNNASWGRSVQYVDNSEIDTAPLSGAEYFDKRPKCRVEKFALNWLSAAEGMNNAFDLQRIVGVTDDVFYIHNPDDTANGFRRWFLGRLQVLDPIAEPYVNTQSTTHTIKERIE